MSSETLPDADGKGIVCRILEFIGESTNRPGLKDTPEETVKAWREMFRGYALDPEAYAKENMRPSQSAGIVSIVGIEFYSTCEVHLLPFAGKISVSYQPKSHFLPTNQLIALIEILAKRLQSQERLTAEIADVIYKIIGPSGAGVVIEAKHFCSICRGVAQGNEVMRTAALKGSYAADETRDPFLNLARGV